MLDNASKLFSVASDQFCESIDAHEKAEKHASKCGLPIPRPELTQFRIFIFLVSAILAGCTEIQVHDAKSVKTTRTFGLTTVEIEPGNATTLTDVRGFGLVIGRSRATLGWMEERLVEVADPSRCQVVFFIRTPALAEKIERLLTKNQISLSNICVVEGDEDA